MAVALWQTCFVIFPALAIFHLYVAPYTKVEESFNLQAIHDILRYGVPLDNALFKIKTYYDHMTFPGAVPRTFIGALVTAGLAKPGAWILNPQGLDLQTHVRSMLGVMNAGALAWFARSVNRAYGPIAALWYVVLQASQFHLWYYASRTLPNMFAFFLSTVALANLLPNPTSSLGPKRRARLGLYLMTIATVVFRSELALLLGAHSLWMLLKPQTLDAKIALIRTTLIPAIIPGALVALLITVTIDTYFWQSETYLWPEMSAFVSNVFPQKNGQGASAWGTQPIYWYLAVALPRLLMNQFLMVDLFWTFQSTWSDIRVLDNQIPSYVYVVLYSLLPHKETRFLFPIVPSFTLLAALTCTRLTINAHKSVITKMLLYGAILSTIVTAFVSHAILLPLSAQNYPGGQAIQVLHEYYNQNWQSLIPKDAHHSNHPYVRVHFTNLALQSGVTRFLEQPPKSDSSIFDSNSRAAASLMHTHDTYAEQRDPLVFPGSPDGQYPALTITPKLPSPSGGATTSNFRRTYKNPTWIYDKTPDNTTLLGPKFWNQFDFIVVEDPAHAAGKWQVIKEIKALGKPRLLKPNEQHHKLSDNTNTKQQDGTAALLDKIYPKYISQPLITVHNLAHDILRLNGLTAGYWLELPLTTKLYIMRRPTTDTASTVAPHHDTDANAVIQPNRYEDHHEVSQIDSAATNQQAVNLNDLGPLVVNKDGTVSRLDNWGQMTAQEKKRTTEYLRKRNLLRLEEGGVEAVVE